MSEINVKNNDFKSNNDNNKSKSNNSYQSLKTKKKTPRNVGISSYLKIIFEFTIILITFYLSLKKAINIVMKNNQTDIKETSNVKSLSDEVGLIKNETKIKKDLKLCICTIGKKENRYIREFVQFYEKMGVDKIFLYDNNEEKGEKFEDVINDYITNGFIEISNWRGKENKTINMMDDCYQKNYKQYDWLIFYDIDEYIHLKNYTNIKDFLNEVKFDKCNNIYLNWVFHTDNYLFHYDNRTLQQRFPIAESKPEIINNSSFNYIKSIIRGNISNITIDCKYKLSNEIKGCNGLGQEPNFIGLNMEQEDFDNYYIEHYFYKCLDEYIEKLNSKDFDNQFKNKTIAKYFKINELAYERIVYLESRTGFNLSEYHQLLKEQNEKNKQKQ